LLFISRNKYKKTFLITITTANKTTTPPDNNTNNNNNNNGNNTSPIIKNTRFFLIFKIREPKKKEARTNKF